MTMPTAHAHYTARIVGGENEGEVVETTLPEVAREEGIYYPERNYQPAALDLDNPATATERALGEAVADMDQGEERTVVLDPGDAFGDYDESAVVTRAVEEIEGEVAEGELVESEDGQTGWIVDVDDGKAVIDFNHELAGERVAFELRLVDVMEE